MKTEQINIKDIFPYPKNNRIHSDKQVQHIADSIKRFGFNQPLVIDENNEILVGHGRLLAAQKLGIKDVPCIKLTKLKAAEKKAYRILDNKLQNDSTWDFEALQSEFESLKADDFDLSFCDLKDLSALFPEPEVEATDDDFEPTEPEDIFIKLGDVIELGKHRVICGDSAVEELAKADMLLTDPPYGIDLNTDYGNRKSTAIKGKKYNVVENDKEMLDFSFLFNLDCISIIFGANNFPQQIPFDPMRDGWIVWDKRGSDIADRILGAPFEIACILGRRSYKFFRIHHCGVVNADGNSARRVHPTQKPVKLFGEIIKEYGADCKTVLDPFLGSGTTLIACEQLNRICYGMEISPKYCQVIIERFKQYCEKNNKPFECKINGESYS